MTYEIGDTAWFGGEAITITTTPYSLYGGQWQDGLSASGKVITVPTPAAKSARVEQQKDEWQQQQAQFRALRA